MTERNKINFIMMKRIIILLTIVLIGTYCFAQKKPNRKNDIKRIHEKNEEIRFKKISSSRYINNLKSQNGNIDFTEKLDSTLWYYDYGSGMVLDGKEKFFYDELGRLVTYHGYYVDGFTSVMKPECKLQLNYPTSNSTEVVYFYYDDNDSLYQEYKDVYYFDNLRNDTLYIDYEWDPVKKDWIELGKISIQYNEQGELVFELHFDWNIDNERWEYNKKYTFISNEDTETITKYIWDTVSEDWKYSSKWVDVYDMQGFDSVHFNYSYDDDVQAWELWGKTEIFTDENGRDTMYIDYLIYGEESKPSSKYYQKFDHNGNNNMWIVLEWSDTVWVNEYKDETIFDTDVSKGSIAWHREIEEAFCVEGSVNSNDLLSWNNDKVLEYSDYYWNNDSEEWEKSGTTKYYYSAIASTGIVGETTIDVYPNPVQDKLHVNLPSQEEIEYCVYDLQGKLVRNGYMEDNAISFENLHRGMYILKLKTRDMIKTGKVLKN